MAYTEGCDFCREILIGFIGTHPIEECPLKKAARCAMCLTRGHFTNTCPRAAEARLVQILDARRAEAHYIAERTKPSVKEALEIIDKDDHIRAYLLSKNIEISQKKGENKEKLKKYADEKGYELTLIKYW